MDCPKWADGNLSITGELKELHFKEVNFSYVDGTKIINNLNLEIPIAKKLRLSVLAVVVNLLLQK